MLTGDRVSIAAKTTSAPPQPSSRGAGRRPLMGRMMTARPSYPFSGFGIARRGSKEGGPGKEPKNRKNIGDCILVPSV